MRAVFFAVATFVLLSASAAHGQYAEVIQACNRDVNRHCAHSQPGGERLTDCVKVHFQSFARRCQTALVKVASVSEACGADIQDHCFAVKPSGGRILMCVRAHFAALSERCKEAISGAAERKLRH